MKTDKKVQILGVNINTLNKSNVDILLKNVLLSDNYSKSPVATVNASFVLKAQNDIQFNNILSNTFLNTADGVSIQMAGEYLKFVSNYSGTKYAKPFVYLWYGLRVGFANNFKKNYTVIKDRITGVYLVKYLLSLCFKNRLSVTIFHRKDSLVSKKTLEDYLNNNYPGLQFEIVCINLQDYDKSLLKSIKSDLVFCTLGEVKQEKFISINSDKINYKVAIGVGGAFDILTGKISFSDNYSKWGLEWFFRLLSNPKRLKKIYSSVVVYPLKLYFYSLCKKSFNHNKRRR